MLSFKKAFLSSVGKKFVMSLSGFALVLFLVVHLLGNLTLLRRDNGLAFNTYSSTLESLGRALIVVELGLVAIILAHIIFAIWLKLNNMAARPIGYAHAQKTKGGPSMSNLSSRNMIITGIVVGVFLVLHVWQFKYGAGEAQGYVATVKDHEVRDLYRLVVETFRNPLFAGLYVAVMIFLGFHLRHGFWSAFQSAAVAYERFSKPIYTLGVIIAIVLAVGFLFIPMWIYFDLGKVLL